MSNAYGDTVVRVQIRMALACIVLAVLGGLFAALHYLPDVSVRLTALGLSMPKVRPLHTTFASVWIFGAAIAVVYHYLARAGDGLSRADMRRFWFHTVCFLTAGIGVFVTLLAGVFSGREYLGFHPVFSVLLLIGWLAFAYNFLRRLRDGFWHRPVYIYFWTVGVLFFVYTFVEGHAYLLSGVQESPIRDLQLQWKSCGTLVGSFNFLVYGALIYVSERLSGDERYGQSGIAFALFGVGCLNSFTNFVHHTYHLPQDHVAKWIAFVVSMIEIVILLRVLSDIGRMLRQRRDRAGAGTAPHPAAGYLTSAKWWTAAMLTVSLVISVPPLNALIHGTHMVTGHAMGTELGIDTMVLFGALAFILYELGGKSAWAQERLGDARMRSHLLVMNLAMAALVTWLSVSGTVHGIHRYLGQPSPAWVGYGQYLFPAVGAVLGGALLYLVLRWVPMLSAAPRARVSAAEQGLALQMQRTVND